MWTGDADVTHVYGLVIEAYRRALIKDETYKDVLGEAFHEAIDREIVLVPDVSNSIHRIYNDSDDTD
jgi:hypothetical protein